MWQDFLLAICTIVLSYALVPQVIHGFKTKHTTIQFQTALITLIGMASIGILVGTLGLYFTMVFDIIAVILWVILLYQAIKYR